MVRIVTLKLQYLTSYTLAVILLISSILQTPSVTLSLAVAGYMSNDLVLKEAGLRQVTFMKRKRHLRLYGHVARLPAEDSAHRIFSCDPDDAHPAKPIGRPQAS